MTGLRAPHAGRLAPPWLWGGALALVFLAAHLAMLPATLEDIDSLNFALGLREFDPARHQPHPPGYPIYIGVARVMRLAAPSDATALALLGAVCGALAILPLLALYERVETLQARGDGLAWWTAALATLLAVTSPSYWFNAHRPMSDIPGLAAILAAQAPLVAAFVRQRLSPERTPEALAASGRLIVLGAFLSALAIGVRSQALWLTLPLLALVLLQRAGRGAAGALLGSAMAFGLGILLWAIPLVAASGGPSAYLAALGAQGGEDFVGVDMLYLNPTPRRLAFNLLETFIYPWASRPLGWAAFTLALIGGVQLLRQAPRAVVLLGVLAGPYLVVHLLLQETLTIRYALPLLPAIAYLTVRGAEAIARGAAAAVRRREAWRPVATALVAGLVLWSLWTTLPAVRIYAAEGTPAFAAVAAVKARLAAAPGVIGLHQGLARVVQTQSFGATRILDAPTMREWLALGEYWRQGGTTPVWFLADPARTDLEAIDPLSRTLAGRFTWNFDRLRFLSGSRPDLVDLVRIASPPGWFGEDGWHLTPELLNRSERLELREAVAYIRSRDEPALLVLGAQHVPTRRLSTGGMYVHLTLDGRGIARWEVPPGGRVFLRSTLEAGALANGAPFNKLVASYAAEDGSPLGIRLTEFAVAPLDAVFAIPHAGWNEIEYGRELQRRWRWTTGRAVTFVNAAGRDVTVSLSAESPLRYFDAPPTVTIRAGDRVLATARPTGDFEMQATVTAADLAAADHMVTIETDRTFVPFERSGSPDRRTLGLRVFDLSVR